jgi:hypothetical protein
MEPAKSWLNDISYMSEFIPANVENLENFSTVMSRYK